MTKCTSYRKINTIKMETPSVPGESFLPGRDRSAYLHCKKENPTPQKKKYRAIFAHMLSKSCLKYFIPYRVLIDLCYQLFKLQRAHISLTSLPIKEVQRIVWLKQPALALIKQKKKQGENQHRKHNWQKTED